MLASRLSRGLGGLWRRIVACIFRLPCSRDEGRGDYNLIRSFRTHEGSLLQFFICCRSAGIVKFRVLLSIIDYIIKPIYDNIDMSHER